MIEPPPAWIKYFSPSLIQKSLKSGELRELSKKADKDYVYWDKFKYYPMPQGFTPEEAWAYIRFSRFSSTEACLAKDSKGKNFTFTITKNMYQKLSLIDSNTSGFLTADVNKPTSNQKNQLIISGLTEEAIASSQIEGANTSRKIAKQMLLSQRKAKTRDEQMIINNYQVMQRLQDWKDLDLSVDMLLEIQKNITINSLTDKNDSGRLRVDEDGINIVNSATGEIVFSPPKAEFVKAELEKLIQYANTDEDEDEFVHPVIKANILHFWLAYLHPFVDGNGRTARALFYWYLLKKNYWMFQYLSVSRSIKKSKTQYDNSFLYTEMDENDLTYFLSYVLKSIVTSIKDFSAYYQEKLEKEKIVQELAGELGEFNARQINLLQDLNTNKAGRVDINTYHNKNRISYETARTDLEFLVRKNLLNKILSGRKYVFVPNTVEIKKLFQSKNRSIPTPSAEKTNLLS